MGKSLMIVIIFQLLSHCSVVSQNPEKKRIVFRELTRCEVPGSERSIMKGVERNGKTTKTVRTTYLCRMTVDKEKKEQ